jgi:polar amino acid transport system substrate-binding protein
MSREPRRLSLLLAGAVSLALLASPMSVSAQDAEESPEASAPASAEPAADESAAPTDETVASVSEACQAGALDDVLTNPGRITVSTDNPAFPPWFEGTVPADTVWGAEGGYPPSGEGFESAIAYAVANALGFGSDQLDWVAQSNFGDAFKPGDKDFDFHLGQVSFVPKRAEAVDFSDSYFDQNQAVVTVTDNFINNVTDLAGLRDFTLGAPRGTTSLTVIEEVIQPNIEPKVYKSLAAARKALQNRQINGLVVDLPTAFFMTAVQLEDGQILGQIGTEADEYFGLILQKDSPLTACVNEAIAVIKADGTWQTIYDTYIGGQNEAFVLQ